MTVTTHSFILAVSPTLSLALVSILSLLVYDHFKGIILLPYGSLLIFKLCLL
jgi:hypothetical protein